MSRLISTRRFRLGAVRQQGAATLLVVMILFFVISMVAAYTNRSLLFEQKTASNQYRSTRALEAADAGVEWALTLLNTGRITANCQTSTVAGDTDFRQRYLDINGDSGVITPRTRTDGTPLYPTCVYNGANWVCDCPSDAAPNVPAPAGTDIFPAFRVRFRAVTPAQPGVVHVDVNGCTALSESCLAFPSVPLAGEGRSTVHVVAALRSAIPSAPVGALTSRGSVDLGAAAVRFINSGAATFGITIHSGQAISSTALDTQLQGNPGTPGSQTKFENDTKLQALDANRFFSNVFTSWRAPYQLQPAGVTIDCAVNCSAAELRNRIALNPGRVFWVIGNLDFDSAGDIGSAAQPVVLNVTGNVTFASPVNVFGLVYSHAGTWTLTGGGSILGAAMAEGNLVGTAASTNVIYSSDVLRRLRTITGSFVRVPGSWKDYET